MDAQAFLEANKLKLIIRSHEGPDARWKREGMQNMDKGHSLDHVTPGLSSCVRYWYGNFRPLHVCFSAQ